MNPVFYFIPIVIILPILAVAIWKSPKHITLRTYTDKKAFLILGSLFLVTLLLCRHFELPRSYIMWGKGITVCLFISAIFTREKTDDERSQQLRYFALKSSFVMMALWSIMHDGPNESAFSPIMGSIVLYFIAFYLADYFNPDYLFKESTTKKPAIVSYVVISAILLIFIIKLITTITY